MKPLQVEPYPVPAWIAPCLERLRPRRRLAVSQWAEQNRVLPGGSAIPGPWRNQVTPYLVEIMDAFDDDQVEQVVFVKPAQVGGTSAMENILGSLIDQQPGPAMVVYPSDALAERTVDAKLEPMIRACPALRERYRAYASKKLQLKFDAMTVYLTGANSPADLSSTSIRTLFLDEVDKYPGASRREADPVSLAMERTKAYAAGRFIFMASTPTLKTGRIWRAKEAAEGEKHYFVPCPRCGQFIELVFAQLRWPGKGEEPDPGRRAAQAAYLCQRCGGTVTDRDKGAMLQAGRWQYVRRDAERPRTVAYWLNTLYSPFTRFGQIAGEFLRAKDDPELLQNFTNSWLAEPWEETRLKTTADLVLECQTDTPAWELPGWARLLTAGIDVQESCFYWTIRAWGEGLTSQNVAHGQALSMAALERVMNTEFPHPSGDRLLVELALMDSGDQTDAVYEFCVRNADWVKPCKGVAAMQGSYRISTINKAGSRANGMQLVLVDGGKYKDMIAARLRRRQGEGAWMVHKDCDREYAEQVTAEHKVTVRKNGQAVQRWALKTSHGANHYLDCEVYAAAAADVLEVRSLFLRREDAPPPPRTEAPPPAPPGEAWLPAQGDWI